MTEPKPGETVHLVQFWGRFETKVVARTTFEVPGIWPRLWCKTLIKGDELFVTEPLFATCIPCLQARTRAASAVKPVPEVQPAAPPENPWG